jgi:amino acid adenylation domain-containing protein
LTANLVVSIAAHASANPARLAIADAAQRLTYADLDRRAGQLAAHLREAGAGPEVCVGLFLERSPEFVVAALAVLKTGAAYLPLDPSTPLDRVAFVLADAGAPLLLTHRGKGKPLAPGAWRVIDLDQEAPAIASRPAEFRPVEVGSDGLAYIIYTSGSTGKPKGVEITHANLANLVAWHLAAFGVTADDRASQVAGLGFDAAVWEIWPVLAAGASLHFADETTRRSPPTLRDWLVAERITIAFVPTVLAEPLLHASWPADTALRTLLTGADTLRRRPATGVPFRFVNNYGPTECAVVATSGIVTADADGIPSIGRPIANTTALILDDNLRPVPPGEVGELCLAGALVGRGYRNNPEATAARFVTLSPEGQPPVRVYRTGDRVSLLPGGDIAFHGRLDDQVKIRGFRIEPGEIVACLTGCPDIESAAVVARETPDGPELVAYVVPGRDARPTVTSLREFLATRLPDYMIPTHFVRLEQLPVTSGGKLDRASLPAPVPENMLPLRPPEERAAAPINGVQQQIAALVASLLGQPTIGADENFFMLGGHSMLAAQLVAQIRDRFGVKLTLRQLFNAPTVAGLAAEVGRAAPG